MRVAANEVERVLQLAHSANVRDDSKTQAEATKTFTGLVAAFKRAAELYDRPAHRARVRSRKGMQTQVVDVLIDRKLHNSTSYALCFIPYTAIEMAGRRRTDIQFMPAHEVVEGKTRKTVRVLLPTTGHFQWIREDRLERTAS